MCQPLMAEGEFALVHEHSEAALTSPSQGWISVGDHDLYNLLADSAVGQRDQAALQKYAPLAEEFASRYEHKLYQAIAYRARGVAQLLAGKYVEAESRLNQALELFNDMNARYQIGRTLFEFGELAAKQSNTSKARGHFTSALKNFESMQAAPDVARAKSALERLN